jgi:hypothetical protein
VVGNPATDKWIASDIPRVIDPDIIVEHYKNRSVTDRHGTKALVNNLRLVRNLLILAPIILTLFGISQAVEKYNELLTINPALVPASFLYLWQ